MCLSEKDDFLTLSLFSLSLSLSFSYYYYYYFIIIIFFFFFFHHSFDSLVHKISDPHTHRITAKCLLSFGCHTIDPETFLSAYILACFPERVADSAELCRTANPLLGAFEMVLAGSSSTTLLLAQQQQQEQQALLLNNNNNYHHLLLKHERAYLEAFSSWKNRCLERLGFWVELCDPLRLVVDYVVYIRDVRQAVVEHDDDGAAESKKEGVVVARSIGVH